MQIRQLNKTEITTAIERNIIGNYWLGNYLPNGIFLAEYVGRSDICLQKRLIQHANSGKYQAFGAKSSSSIREAFEIECREYHMLLPGLSNSIHPRIPRHYPLPCPYCNFHIRIIDSDEREEF